MAADLLPVEVVYARPDGQTLLSLKVRAGATLREAIEMSGVLALFPEVDLGKSRVGTFGRLRELSDAVEAGDRVEIYRELVADPKEARRQRAARTKRGTG
jgi:hypothetical protein